MYTEHGQDYIFIETFPLCLAKPMHYVIWK